MSSLPIFQEPPPLPPLPARGFALFALGFRPFYLLACVFAAVSVPLWALQFSGLLGQPYLAGPLWHGHEMVFGFAQAVIVGFLLTAGRNWTGRPTPTGWRLGALVAWWVAARVLVLTPFAGAAALANIGFPLAAIAALAPALLGSKNRRNYFFLGLLGLFAVAAALVHGASLGLIDGPPQRGLQLALNVVLFIVCVMGGRVVPMFTNNAVPGAGAVRQTGVDRLALGAVLALLAAEALGLSGPLTVALAALASAAHAWRWVLWRPWKTLHVPILWVLHIGYLWVPVHLALRGLAGAGLVAPSLATHALAAGAIGALIMGMVTRTALGHTGRPLRAGRAEFACYNLVLLAALLRVGVPLVDPALTVPAVLLSATLWSAGFGLYALRYWAVLSRPRLDGRPG